MLFVLFVIIFIVGVIWAWIDDCGAGDFIGSIIALFMGICIIGSGFIMIDAHGNTEAYIAECNQTYESLVYQLENNLYDNDNDLGKKELYDEIREWNEDLAYYQNTQDNFWIGIYYPNIYDQFEYIEYN